MNQNEEINPINKKDELCALLDKTKNNYRIYQNGDEKEYGYLQEGDLCITVENPNDENHLYIDLELDGEFTLSYYKWHQHYFPDITDFERLKTDIINILHNEKGLLIISSNKRWLSSRMPEETLDDTYDYKEDIKKLPKEFQEEIEEYGGFIEFYFWNKERCIKKEI